MLEPGITPRANPGQHVLLQQSRLISFCVLLFALKPHKMRGKTQHESQVIVRFTAFACDLHAVLCVQVANGKRFASQHTAFRV